ncbi:hypothetical protein VMCG_01917 [Cytospora schulzeri]|uniref:AAA+ ATPase domain-containing protein n=1 Tax=Cytospora schulzeri TaxID=448051 RepID=A0A423X4I4_9PEZI|nr:hypothetical protein VMCG_01917 [Valsa malicola]
MEGTSTQSPTPVAESAIEGTKHHPSVTGGQQDEDEDTGPIETMRSDKHVEDSTGHQGESKTLAEKSAIGDAVEAKHNSGRTSPGKEVSGQKYAGDPQNMTGEAAYHWLKDITARVDSIESKLDEQKSDATDSTVTSDEDDSYFFRTRPEVKDCHWEAFKNRFPTEDNMVPAIETLLRYAELDIDIEEEQLKRKSHGSGSSLADQKPFKPSSKSPSLAPDDRYERIRINSAFIQAFLAKAAEDGPLTIRPVNSLTFLRPFKALIHFHEQMEKEFLWLEKKFGNPASANQALALETEESPDKIFPEVSVEEDQSANEALIRDERRERNNTASSITPNENEGKVKSSPDIHEVVENGSYEAYRQMKCYVDFVRTKLIPRYQRFEAADYRDPPRVRYEDLWSLFRMGELIIRQDAFYQRVTDRSDGSLADSKNPRYDTEGSHLWRIVRISTPLPNWVVDDLSLEKEGEMWGGGSEETQEIAVIEVYYVDFDGKSYSSVPFTVSIPYFADEKDITSLPAYPVRFAKDYEQTVKQLQKRGEIFQSVVSQANPVQTYEGWTLIRDPAGRPIQDANANFLKSPEHIDGDVIIDFHEALQIHPWWKPPMSKYSKEAVRHGYSEDDFPINSWADKERSKLLRRTWEWVYGESDGVAASEFNHAVATTGSHINKDHDITDVNSSSAKPELSSEDLVLLPSRIFVYALRERKFVNADVQYLRQISVKENPFESLEIEEEHKDLIVSTVFEHFERKKVRRDAQRQGVEMSDQDFIRGKGRGLIILLHGAPGVGKTATAEACSYAYNKPLFPITCGDLGIEPERVEETLSELFRLANLWDCIMLFDEADIFLSTREKKDDNLQRNALVSIFLRTLEYYSGVLFLTTNRAGVLDEAVKSRVHLSLYYPYLGLKETKTLFQMNIGRLKNIEAERAKITGSPPMAIEEKRILKFAEEHYMRFEKEYDKRWNGRQIRNAFQIATSLARHQYHRHCLEGNSHRGLYMTSDHFQAVEDATNKYDEYRQKLFNKTDVEIAKEREERYHPS